MDVSPFVMWMLFFCYFFFFFCVMKHYCCIFSGGVGGQWWCILSKRVAYGVRLGYECWMCTLFHNTVYESFGVWMSYFIHYLPEDTCMHRHFYPLLVSSFVSFLIPLSVYSMSFACCSVTSRFLTLYLRFTSSGKIISLVISSKTFQVASTVIYMP